MDYLAFTESMLDIFLVCQDRSGSKFFQIWVNEKDSGFIMTQQGSLPAGVQAISFADVGRQSLPHAAPDDTLIVLW